MMNNVIQTIGLVDKITEVNIGYEIQKKSDINALCKFVAEKQQKEQAKLPYHINIIDLIGANENAHSRILEHLLKQCNYGRFEILENLLEYIVTTNQNFKLNVHSPFITAEKERIDVLVKDKEYAIIFENKIHNAIDQRAQLSRYIEKVSEMGYRKEQIYILYLPRDEGKSPNDDSWGEYREIFENRYMRLTYRNHILPWLREFLLPNIRIKDVFLKSCVEQYIDHLEGLFSLRNMQLIMNKEVRKKICELLELGTSSEKNHSILLEKMKEIDQVRDQLSIIQSNVEKECWEEWLKRLKIDFPNLELINSIDDKSYPKVGVKLYWNDIAFGVLIEKETNSNTIYYGIGRHYASESINDGMKEFFNPLLDGFKPSQWWYGWKYTSFENGYTRLKGFINEVLRHINGGN